MKIPKSDPIVGVLIVLVVLAVTLVMLKVFTLIMIALWVMSIIMWVEFHGALSSGRDTRSSLVSFFVKHGKDNGLSPTEVCTRGRKVAGVWYSLSRFFISLHDETGRQVEMLGGFL